MVYECFLTFTLDAESLSDDEGVHLGTQEKEERPGKEKDGDQKRDGRADCSDDGNGFPSAQGDHGDGDGDLSDGDGPSDGEGDPSDDGDVSSDDDVTPFVKRNGIARRQRIDSDDDGEDPPILKQLLSLGSSDSTLGNLLVPSPSTSSLQREADERIVQLKLENTSEGMSNLQKTASDLSESSRLQSDRPFGSLTPREAAEVCQMLAEEGEEVDSGLGLRSKENPCSQLLVDASSQEGLPHLRTISEEGSCLQGVGSRLRRASDEGSDLNMMAEEGSCTQGAGDMSSVDTSFSSFPPAQPRHSPNPKVSGMTRRKDSITSNQSDQVSVCG